jgi:hypothetical protein
MATWHQSSRIVRCKCGAVYRDEMMDIPTREKSVSIANVAVSSSTSGIIHKIITSSSKSGPPPMAERRLKRPRDPIQLGKLIGDIATGQIKDEEDNSGKSEVAIARGRRGGPARARALTPEQRSEIARIAAEARWKKSGG